MQDFFNWQGVVGTIIGIIGTVFALFAWHKSRQVENFLEEEKVRLSEKITVILSDGKREIVLPAFRRQEFTRGEIQGRLGTIPTKEKNARYSINYTFTPEYYEMINKIIEGSSENSPSVVHIKCTDEEMAQFAPAYVPTQAITERVIVDDKKTPEKV